MKSEIEDLKNSENECPDVNEKISPNRAEDTGGSKRLSAPPGFEKLTTALPKDSISNNSSQDIVTQDNSSMKHSSVDNLSTKNSLQSDSTPEKSSMKQLSVDKLSSKKGSYVNVDTLSMKNSNLQISTKELETQDIFKFEKECMICITLEESRFDRRIPDIQLAKQAKSL